ncbi:MAG: phage major capsid protein [Streptosporangiales bacterium]
MPKRKSAEELAGELGAIRSELLDLDGVEEPTGEQVTRSTELLDQYETKKSEHDEAVRYERQIDGIRDAAANPANRESERSPQVQTRTSPFGDLDAVRSHQVSGSDLRARALTAIEQAPGHMSDDQRGAATGLVERGDRHGRISRHMLLTGSDGYSRAFEQILTGAQPWSLAPDEQEALRIASDHNRAMNEGTNSAGGYLVPFHLDPTIILTSAGSTNPLRQISRVDTISTNEWHGVSSAGVSAEWLAEAAEAAGDTASLVQPTVTVHKAAAWLQASFEVTQDTGIAGQVGMLLAEARDDLEAAAFATGSGSGQPTGVVTAVAADTGSVVDGGTGYAVDSVYQLKSKLTPRHRPVSSWLANDNILSLTRQFATGSGPQHAFWADLGMDTPPQLLGRPLYEASEMADTVATGANVLLVGNFARYLIVNRIGMTMQFEPLVKGANRRPTGEVGWFAHWRVGGNALDTNAFRLLQMGTVA